MSNYLTYDLDCSVLGFLGLWSGRTAGSTTIARSDLKIDLKVYSKLCIPITKPRNNKDIYYYPYYSGTQAHKLYMIYSFKIINQANFMVVILLRLQNKI